MFYHQLIFQETSERVKAERSQQAAAELAKREEAKRAEEMKRLEQENIESERKRRLAEQEEVQRKIKQDQLRRMQNTAIYQAIVREKGEQVFKDMDPEAVLREQVRNILKLFLCFYMFSFGQCETCRGNDWIRNEWRHNVGFNNRTRRLTITSEHCILKKCWKGDFFS